MSPSPQRRRPTLLTANPSLDNACQKLATVNPSDAPRTNLNNPEQIRTPPNAPTR